MGGVISGRWIGRLLEQDKAGIGLQRLLIKGGNQGSVLLGRCCPQECAKEEAVSESVRGRSLELCS